MKKDDSKSFNKFKNDVEKIVEKKLEKRGIGVRAILERARKLRKHELNMDEIIIMLGNVLLNKKKIVKNKESGFGIEEEEFKLKAHLGFMVLMSICWCDDLGYDSEECLKCSFALAEEAVKKGGEIF